MLAGRKIACPCHQSVCSFATPLYESDESGSAVCIYYKLSGHGLGDAEHVVSAHMKTGLTLESLIHGAEQDCQTGRLPQIRWTTASRTMNEHQSQIAECQRDQGYVVGKPCPFYMGTGRLHDGLPIRISCLSFSPVGSDGSRHGIGKALHEIAHWCQSGRPISPYCFGGDRTGDCFHRINCPKVAKGSLQGALNCVHRILSETPYTLSVTKVTDF